MQPISQSTFLKSNNSQFISFVKSPKQISNNKISKFYLLLYCFLLQCCVTILDFTNLSFFEYLEKTKILGNLKLVISENPADIKFKSQTFFFIVACFIGPFLEEIIYRLPLLKKFRLLLFVPLFSFLFYHFFSFSYITSGVVVLAFLTYSIYFYLQLTHHFNHFNFLNYVNKYSIIIYDKLFPLIFYVLAIIFAFSHIENYFWCASNLLSGSLIIFFIFISHILYGYLILNCGFWYAVFLHCIQNVVVSLLP